MQYATWVLSSCPRMLGNFMELMWRLGLWLIPARASGSEWAQILPSSLTLVLGSRLVLRVVQT